MRQNTFYLMAGVIGLAEVGIFWLAVELKNPFLITGSFLIGIFFIYALWTKVSDRGYDERAVFITEKAKSRTLDVFWVLFFAVSLGSAVIGFSAPLRIPKEPPFPKELPLPPSLPPDRPFMGYFGLFQLILLFLLILLYLVFRIYYARKYGDWDRDEE